MVAAAERRQYPEHSGAVPTEGFDAAAERRQERGPPAHEPCVNYSYVILCGERAGTRWSFSEGARSGMPSPEIGPEMNSCICRGQAPPPPAVQQRGTSTSPRICLKCGWSTGVYMYMACI